MLFIFYFFLFSNNFHCSQNINQNQSPFKIISKEEFKNFSISNPEKKIFIVKNICIFI
jgi:hypothetical protein